MARCSAIAPVEWPDSIVVAATTGWQMSRDHDVAGLLKNKF
ncbi:hypothetical protein [Limnothrix sp. FACHB-1088]|nr:hypothetical protein [Limnothrix sp. FACHB-1088]